MRLVAGGREGSDARDHGKLRAFELADQLVLDIYRITQTFPAEARFGLMQQMRRAAVSITSNIVEGSARHSRADYLRFLDMAYASSCELGYQRSLAFRPGFVRDQQAALNAASEETSSVLNGLVRSPRNRD